MQEIIEQKGKPCCINMITDEDKKYLANLEKLAAKAARRKARAEAAVAAEAEGSVAEANPVPAQVESEEEVDEITLLVQKEEKENAERAVQEEAIKK